MLNRDPFDNETTLRHFRKSDLDSMSYFIELWLFNVSNKIRNIINSDIAITCYGSDSRLDKWNREKSSIDLLICNNNNELVHEDILNIIKEIVSKNTWIIEDNSYFEIWDNGEMYEIDDSIELWNNIEKIQIDPEYIDILSQWDELYKYKWKYFPDRLIDAYFIWWNKKILESFKKEMLDNIINDSSILKKYKKWIKNYYKQDYINGKNHRNWLEKTYSLWERWWLIKFDNEKYFWFKHGPLRALQYKIIELFLKLVIDKKDSNLINNFPFDMKWRLEFLFNNDLLDLNLNETKDILEIYIYFKELNIKLERLLNIENFNINTIDRLEGKGEFYLIWSEYNIKLSRFSQLFNKIS